MVGQVLCHAALKKLWRRNLAPSYPYFMAMSISRSLPCCRTCAARVQRLRRTCSFRVIPAIERKNRMKPVCGNTRQLCSFVGTESSAHILLDILDGRIQLFQHMHLLHLQHDNMDSMTSTSDLFRAKIHLKCIVGHFKKLLAFYFCM